MPQLNTAVNNTESALINSLLIVEDDDSIREMLLYILQKEDYRVAAVASAEAGLAHYAAQNRT